MEITKVDQSKEKLVLNVKVGERQPGTQTSIINVKKIRQILQEDDLLKGFHAGPIEDLEIIGNEHSNKYGSINAEYIITKKQKTIENINNVTKVKTTAAKRKAVKQNGKN
mgnify:CR=1 FL=1